ncbi:MAG: VirB3 family type IV secretion system protein [bacterium]|jgi:type IV secretory pathway TrbD component
MPYEPRATPVFEALIVPKLLAGADRRLTILNGTVALGLLLAAGWWWWAGIALAVQALFKWLTARDPHLFAAYRRYLAEGDVYDPFARAFQRNNVRPEGFGRDTLC